MNEENITENFFDDRIIKEQSDVYQIAKICIEVFRKTGHKLIWVDRVKANTDIIKIIAQNNTDNITVKECQIIHKNVQRSPQLQIISANQYKIEVSSPGKKRPLVRKKDFHDFQNHKVAIKIFQQNEKIIGKIIKNCEEKQQVSILVEKPKQKSKQKQKPNQEQEQEQEQEIIEIKYKDIRKAHTVVDNKVYQDILRDYKNRHKKIKE